MPFNQVMHKFGQGQLHSGSKAGPAVKNPKQAVAIMMSERQKAENGDAEYQPSAPKANPFKKKASVKGLKSAI